MKTYACFTPYFFLFFLLAALEIGGGNSEGITSLDTTLQTFQESSLSVVSWDPLLSTFSSSEDLSIFIRLVLSEISTSSDSFAFSSMGVFMSIKSSLIHSLGRYMNFSTNSILGKSRSRSFSLLSLSRRELSVFHFEAAMLLQDFFEGCISGLSFVLASLSMDFEAGMEIHDSPGAAATTTEKKSSVSIEGISTVFKGSRGISTGISVNSTFGLISGLFLLALTFSSGFLLVISFSLAPSFLFVFAVFGDCLSFFSKLTATSVLGCRLLVIISSAYLRFISRQAAVLGVTTGLNNVSSQFSWMTVSSPVTASWSLSSSECTFTTVPKGFTTLATAGFICTITQRPPGQKEPMAGYFDFFYAGYVLCEVKQNFTRPLANR
nr:unnamed protein product [Callosobruchus chinensis]